MPQVNATKNYNGIYVPKNGIGAGYLAVAGKDTTLKLVDTKPWKKPRAEFRDHHGFLADGRKASLLQCLSMGGTNHRWGPGARYEIRFFPHYILLGEAFIRSGDTVVRALHYHFENIDCLVHNFGTFSSIHPERDEFRRILRADYKRSIRIARKEAWEERPFAPQIGDHPHLLYFNGIWEIAQCAASIGVVRVTNCPSYSLGSSSGIGFENEITVSLD